MSRERIAVLGAAHDGRQLAAELAAAGFEILFNDLMPNNTERAKVEIETNLQAFAAANRIPSAAEALARIEFVPLMEDAMRSSHIVFEYGPDDLESKLEMFSLLERLCLPGTVIVSMARNFSVSFVASVTMRHAEIVELHWETKPEGGRRIVLKYTGETSPETIARVEPIARQLCSDVELSLEKPEEATK
jgi:3-hydroxybutyryl-CoA dehydrogenase